ncbi:hypothetical protein F0562_011742 [Nyssa sinensis]|uniref:Uncharacterized protein n=1 Tax=Nyssa sinensis TaxID=561372 RepID=A0A5J4ZQY6_9ASTE|nr:hypothetical protein F0562_011742 [Nyssa sinensis]
MMMSRNVARSAVAYVSPRFFSTATVTGLLTAGQSSALVHVNNPSNGLARKAVTWISFPVVGVRNGSSMASGKKEENEEEKKRRSGDGDLNDKAIISYWGIDPGTVTKEDGTKWEWSCFKDIHYQGHELKQHRWDITEGKEISWLRNEIDRSMMI